MAVNRLYYVLGIVLFTKPFNFMTKQQKTDKFNKDLFLSAMFSPCVKLKDVGKGLLMANCPESKKILKKYKGAHWLLESDYDNFLQFVSKFGASIEVEY